MTDRVPDYAQGFKDGFASGLEEGKKLVEEQWRQDKIKEIEKSTPKPQWGLGDYVFGAKDNCPKCGMTLSNVMGYVCASPNCPTFPNVTCVGAVGSTNQPEYPMGAVGAAGDIGHRNGDWYDGQWYPDRSR